MMKYHTRSGSVYEVDEANTLIRRDESARPHPNRGGTRLSDGEWHAYQTIDRTTRGELRIDFGDDYVVFTTKIIKVEGIN